MQRHQPCTRCYAHPPTLTAVDRRDGLNIPMLRAPTDTGLRRWRGSTPGTPPGATPLPAANKRSPPVPPPPPPPPTRASGGGEGRPRDRLSAQGRSRRQISGARGYRDRPPDSLPAVLVWP